MADAPGIFVATTRALMVGTDWARAACQAAPPPTMAIAAAKAMVPGKLIVNVRTFIRL
jgi:hypothetical protein